MITKSNSERLRFLKGSGAILLKNSFLPCYLESGELIKIFTSVRLIFEQLQLVRNHVILQDMLGIE